MKRTNMKSMNLAKLSIASALVIVVWQGLPLTAQRGAPPPQQPPRSPRQAAPIDLTGYWVSVVSEDWRFRMVAAPKGDYTGVALNAAGRKLADSWDPAKDRAEGNQCKAYGAAGLMRLPGRLHITWADDDTLKIDFSAGKQTRLFDFDRPARVSSEPQMQGYSVATWEIHRSVDQYRTERESGGAGTLKVVTTGMRPGYLRLNGVPYSDRAVLTEYFDAYAGPQGQRWLTVTSIVSDPVYLARELVTSTDFKKEPDGAKFAPTPCETLLPRGEAVKSGEYEG